MNLTPADVTLALHETGRTVKHGRGFNRRETTLKTYNVLHEGQVIGTVELDMATFENRTKGRMYVNRRWESPRWFYRHDNVSRRSPYHETRKSAVEGLLWSLKRVAEEAAR